MAIITTSTGKTYDTSGVDLAKQAALYDQIRANSTNVGGTDVLNSRVQGDSRGSWIGAPTNVPPNTWVGAMSHLNSPEVNAIPQGGGDPSQLASNLAKANVAPQPGIVSRPYAGGRPPMQNMPFTPNFNPMMRLTFPGGGMMPGMANRTAMGPGTMQPAMRQMPRVGQTPMPQRPMPAFPGMLPNPYVQADASGISPQQRGQQGGLSPALMQYLASLQATFGGSVPPGIFGPAPQFNSRTPGTLPPANPLDPNDPRNASGGSINGLV